MAKLSRKYRYAYLLVKLYIQVYKKLRREFLRNSFKYIFLETPLGVSSLIHHS